MNLTEHFKVFGLAPSDGILTLSGIIEEYSNFFSSDNFGNRFSSGIFIESVSELG